MYRKNKIKILFISHSSAMIGAERSLLLLLKNIDRDCFQPIVVFPTSGPLKKKIEHLGIKTYDIKYPRWVRRRNFLWIILRFGYCIIQEVLALPKFCKIIKHEQISVVYTNTITIFSGAILAFITKIPHIWHIREIISGNPDLHLFFPNKLLFRLILKWSSMIIANSNATAAQFQTGEKTQKIKVIYNAVDLEKFRVSALFPKIGGVSPEDWLVAVVGSLQRRKGQNDAIHAIKIIEAKIPNIKLLLVGEGNANFTDYLKQMVSDLNLTDKVIFTGYRDDIPQILFHCKLLLMPSWEEPFGRVSIEAMAAGIPVIGTNSGGTKEIIEEGLTGYLVPPQNPAEIAEKMIQLHDYPELARRIGNNGKKFAKEKFASQSYSRSVEESILQVVDIL